MYWPSNGGVHPSIDSLITNEIRFFETKGLILFIPLFLFQKFMFLKHFCLNEERKNIFDFFLTRHFF